MWPHYGATPRGLKRRQDKASANRRVTCCRIDKPKARCARLLPQAGQIVAEPVALLGDVPGELGTAHQQPQPAQISRRELPTLRGHQNAPNEPVAVPRRVDELALPENPKQLEGRIGRRCVAGLPMPDSAQAHTQQIGCAFPRQPCRLPFPGELIGRDRAAPRATAVPRRRPATLPALGRQTLAPPTFAVPHSVHYAQLREYSPDGRKR